jgi:hypothetical protein
METVITHINMETVITHNMETVLTQKQHGDGSNTTWRQLSVIAQGAACWMRP